MPNTVTVTVFLRAVMKQLTPYSPSKYCTVIGTGLGSFSDQSGWGQGHGIRNKCGNKCAFFLFFFIYNNQKSTQTRS
jgi:hypothetical protein